MSKHTPGPWVIDWNVSRLDVFSIDASKLVATLRRSTLSEGIDQTAIANARLISAAPELLQALQSMLQWMPVYPAGADGIVGGREAHAEAIKAARAAIAKATGEA